MKLVEIHWIDSVGFEGGWCQPDVLEDTDMVVNTIGFLVDETEHGYTISSSEFLCNGTVHSPLKIPKVSVIGLWEIKLK